jgi:hypothetical protein
MDRPEPSGVAEWREQTFDGTLFVHALAEGRVPMRREKDGRNGLSAPPQLALQVYARHAGQGDIAHSELARPIR